MNYDTSGQNLVTFKQEPYIYSCLCDFCPGYTTVEAQDEGLYVGPQEGYAMQVTDSDGREWGFCPDCLRDALLGGLENPHPLALLNMEKK